METVSRNLKLAVLIDADNAQPSLAGALLEEIATYGIANVKRIYGDWTQPNLRSWKDQLAQHAIQPMQQFGYTTGKNSTDGALIIDAMDLLFTGRFDGFCIVSSDSDFTGLAMRIRQAGLTVYGFGEKKTPKAFVSACNKFIDVDVLRGPSDVTDRERTKSEPAAPNPKPEKAASPSKAAANKKPAAPEPNKAGGKIDPRKDQGLLRLLHAALDDAADDEGWAALGELGNLVNKRAPAFDQRKYGFAKLSGLIAALGLFEIEKRGPNKAIYLRERPVNKKKNVIKLDIQPSAEPAITPLPSGEGQG